MYFGVTNLFKLKTMNKIEERLRELFIARTQTEKNLIISLRYDTKPETVELEMRTLSTLKIRIQEISQLLDFKSINKIKEDLDIDFN